VRTFQPPRSKLSPAVKVAGGGLLARRLEDEGAAGPQRGANALERLQILRGIGEIAEARVKIYGQIEGLVGGESADIGAQETGAAAKAPRFHAAALSRAASRYASVMSMPVTR